MYEYEHPKVALENIIHGIEEYALSSSWMQSLPLSSNKVMVESLRAALARVKSLITKETTTVKTLLISKTNDVKSVEPHDFMHFLQEEAVHKLEIARIALSHEALEKDWVEKTAKSTVKCFMTTAAIQARTCKDSDGSLDAIACHWEESHEYRLGWHDIVQRAIDEKFQGMFSGAVDSSLSR